MLALRDVGECAAGQGSELERRQAEHCIGRSGGCPDRLEGVEIGVEQDLGGNPMTYRGHTADRVAGHLAYIMRIRAVDLLADERADLLLVDSIYS